jgi:hemoglobin
MVFGGPNGNAGQDLRESYQPLVARGLNGEHFPAVVGHISRYMYQSRSRLTAV